MAGLVGLLLYIIVPNIPLSLEAMTAAQTAVTVISLSMLMLLVVTHHRRGGNIVSQAQEEIILIASFGLFWLALMLAYRAFRNVWFGEEVASIAEDVAQAYNTPAYWDRYRAATIQQGWRSRPGHRVVEEWRYSR